MAGFDIARGLVYEIRPLPMLAALLCAWIGVRLAGGGLGGAWPLLALVFLGLYAGHLVDSFVDYEVRREPKFVYLGVFEDSGGLLPGRVLLGATALSAVAFALILSLARPAGPLFYVVALMGLAVAVSYSPLLDRNAVTVSLSYPGGVVLALLGGFLIPAPSLTLQAGALALVIGVFLAGGKIVSDQIDYESDLAMGKVTVPVALGVGRGALTGYALCAAGLAAAAGVALAGVLPRITLAGVVVASVLLVASTRFPVRHGIVVLVAGGYAYLAAILLAIG